MLNYRLTYGSDTAIVTMPAGGEQHILVDGEEIGHKFADARCDVEYAMEFAARHCWGGAVDVDGLTWEVV